MIAERRKLFFSFLFFHESKHVHASAPVAQRLLLSRNPLCGFLCFLSTFMRDVCSMIVKKDKDEFFPYSQTTESRTVAVGVMHLTHADDEWPFTAMIIE